jgi:hypothetical protein
MKKGFQFHMKSHKIRMVKQRVLLNLDANAMRPLHISQVTLPAQPIAQVVSPEILRSIVTSPQYRNYLNSIKFGMGKVFKGKWWIWILVAVIAMFAFLLATGKIPGM